MRNITLIVFAAVLSGCFSGAEIEGQAFLNGNSASTKLSQVTLQAVPEEALLKWLKLKTPELGAEYKRLSARVKDAEANYSRAVSMAGRVQAQLQTNLMAIQMGIASPSTAAYLAGSGQQMGEQAASLLKTTEEELKNSLAELDGLRGWGRFYYVDTISGAISTTQSDADGKFKIALSKSGRTAIVARKDTHYWLIWVSHEQKGPLLLTDKNLSGTGCVDCIFNDASLASSLSFIKAVIEE